MNNLRKRSIVDPGCELIAARQPKAETEEVAPDKSGPRRMLNERQVLEIIPSPAPRFLEWKKRAGFPNRLTSHRTAGSGSRIRLSLGRTPLMNSIRAEDGARGVAIMLQADKTHHRGKPGNEWY